MLDIKRVIKAHGFTIEQTAKKLGINRVTLSQKIVGNPTTKTLEEIAKVIGASPAEFFLSEDASTITANQPMVCPHCGHPLTITIG